MSGRLWSRRELDAEYWRLWRLACRRVREAGGRRLTQADWAAVMFGPEGEAYRKANTARSGAYHSTERGKATRRRAEARRRRSPGYRAYQRRYQRARRARLKAEAKGGVSARG